MLILYLPDEQAMKAVIPAGGFGTRFLPMTKSCPKEMLPLVDKPAIQYVIEEAVESGITDILVITGRGKRAIEDHFDRNLELEMALAQRGDAERLASVQSIAELADIHYVRQKETRGLGHAILCARKHIGNEPFAVLLADDVVFGAGPGIRQLLRRFEQRGASLLAVERVTPERIEAYGVVDPREEVAPNLFRVGRLVEKPRRAEAPSDLGILGRYVLTPEIFDALEATPPGRNGEIQLTDGLQRLVARHEVHAHVLDGRRRDVGDRLEWLKANVELALERDELHAPLIEFLDGVLGRGRWQGGLPAARAQLDEPLRGSSAP